MTPEERDQVRSKIRDEIERLERDIPALEKQIQPIAPDSSLGRLTRMEAIASKSIQEANLRTAKHRLAQLKVALMKVDDEEFGLCKECDEPIPLGRLLVMPEKGICVDCASQSKRN